MHHPYPVDFDKARPSWTAQVTGEENPRSVFAGAGYVEAEDAEADGHQAGAGKASPFLFKPSTKTTPVMIQP